MIEKFNFENGKVRLMGKDYKLSDDVTNQQMIDFQKDIEKLYKKYEPSIDKGDLLNKEFERTERRIEQIESSQWDIREKGNLTDDDVKKLGEYTDKIFELEDKLDEITAEIKKFNKETEKEVNKISEAIREKTAEMASIYFEDLTKEQYLKESDDIDEAIIKNMPIIRKDMYSGKSSREITDYMIKYFDKEKEELFGEETPIDPRGRRDGRGFRG